MWTRAAPPRAATTREDVGGTLWVRPGRHAHRPRQRQRVRRARGVLPRACSRYSGHVSEARRLHAASVADVERRRHRARGLRLPRRSASPIPAYPLRPEIIESTWYLYRAHRGSCSTARSGGGCSRTSRAPLPHGEPAHAALADVTTEEQADDMESFVLAETFKYFYLLFAPADDARPQAAWCSNTEAHPAAARAATLGPARWPRRRLC